MERLRRLERLFVEVPHYFVTACTHERKALLADDATHLAFLKFCALARDHGAWVGRYVPMPDHFHLFVAIPPSTLHLSAWIKSLKNSLSSHWRQRGLAAPHWQKGFFDHLMRSDESYAQKWAYVRDNPVRAGLVARPEDWPFAGEILPTALTLPPSQMTRTSPPL